MSLNKICSFLDASIIPLGHMQQGGWPSPFDRNVATKMAAKTVTWLVEQLTHCAALDRTVYAEDPKTATLLGMRTRGYKFQPVSEVKKETDFTYRKVSYSGMKGTIGCL